MAPGFDDLSRELDRWQAAGRVASLWWRDDDAVAPTPALTRLLDQSDDAGVEIAVAVIPARADDTLADAFSRRPRAKVLQHGYAHTNHGRLGEPAVELGGERPLRDVLDELAIGYSRLDALFDGRNEKVLAAPWNRIERPVLERLADIGFVGASAYGPRSAMAGVDGLRIANAHVDPMNWRERRFAGDAKTLSGFLGELAARRTGASEPDEPLGLLTHHLDHDAAMWDFLERFFAATRAHPAVRWLTIAEAFAPPEIAAASGVRR